MSNDNTPSWARWIETPQGVIVSGRHRTSRTNKIASEISAIIGLLVLVDSFCFSYSVVNRVIVVLAKLYNPRWTADGIYGCIFFGGFVGAMVVMAMLTPLVTIFVRQKSSVRFSANTIAVPRWLGFGWRRLNRTAASEPQFFARSREHVHAYQHADKMGNITSGVTAFDVFTVHMRLGWNEVRIGEFIDEDKAACFIGMCEAAAVKTQTMKTRSELQVMTLPLGRPTLPERVSVRRQIT